MSPKRSPTSEKYTKEKIEEDKSVKTWLNAVRAKSNSSGTVRNYLYSLCKHCNWIGMSPDELIEERKSDMLKSDEKEKHRHEETVREYFNELDEQLSRNTAKFHVMVLKSFYKANYVPLQVETPKTWIAHQDYVPTLEDAQRMYSNANTTLERALLSFLCQSGQRISVVCSMTYGMVKDGLNKEVFAVDILGSLKNIKGKMTNKNRKNYYFVIGKDTIEALKEYVESMRTLGFEYADDTPLFMSEERYSAFSAKSGMKKIHCWINPNRANKIIREIAKKTGLLNSGTTLKSGRTRYRIHCHSFRKFFNTQMEVAGMPYNWHNFMMGHSLGQVNGSYSRPTKEMILNRYQECKHYITVNPSTELKAELEGKSKEVEKLVQEKSVLKIEERIKGIFEREQVNFVKGKEIEQLKENFDTQLNDILEENEKWKEGIREKIETENEEWREKITADITRKSGMVAEARWEHRTRNKDPILKENYELKETVHYLKGEIKDLESGREYQQMSMLVDHFQETLDKVLTALDKKGIDLDI